VNIILNVLRLLLVLLTKDLHIRVTQPQHPYVQQPAISPAEPYAEAERTGLKISSKGGNGSVHSARCCGTER
jgi:hypothetical protein